MPSKKLTPVEIWNGLNDRQRRYLRAIYDVDQEKEKHEKEERASGDWDRPPASEWRWINYDPLVGVYFGDALYEAIGKKQIDSGTGSTFEALETRKLIERKWQPFAPSTHSILYVKITTLGRKVIREVYPELKPEKPLPVGTLREWHWEALKMAYEAGDSGVEQKLYYSSYGGVSWNTWLRLRDYQRQGQYFPLVKEHKIPGEKNAHSGLRDYTYVMMITDNGKWFYEFNLDDYKRLYPNLYPPPPPSEEEIREREAIEQRRREGIKAGLERAKRRGQHVGRPSAADDAILSKYPQVVEALERGESLRSIGTATGVAVNTVRKVKDILSKQGRL